MYPNIIPIPFAIECNIYIDIYVLVCPQSGRSSCWTKTEVIRCFDCGLFSFGMLSKSQVVSWGIVNTVIEIEVVILGQNLCIRTGEHSSVVQPKLILNEFVDVMNWICNSIKEMSAFGLTEGRNFNRINDCFNIYSSLQNSRFLIVLLHVDVLIYVYTIIEAYKFLSSKFEDQQ